LSESFLSSFFSSFLDSFFCFREKILLNWSSSSPSFSLKKL
jgi:hypothetical protein